MHGALSTLQSWQEIRSDVTVNWYIYASMPLIAALIGYVTKVVALEMLYRPLEFKGIGLLGWQGLVPRRAGKVAAITIDMLTENILKPEDLLDNIDAAEAVAALREPMEAIVDDIARELVEGMRPGLWDALPASARRAVINAAHARAPQIVDNILDRVREDLSQVIDVKQLAVTTLVRNKQKLNHLMRNTAGGAMSFVRRSGIYFGLGIGLVQVVAWALFHNVWIMPAFGFATGFISDYVALNMLFAPRHPRTFLGLRIHGVLHAQRDEITRNYARIMATDLFSPEALFEAVMTGPGSDRLFSMVQKEIDAAIDSQMRPTGPLVRLTIGTRRYRDIKTRLAARVIERIPETAPKITEFAGRTLDLENVLIEKMSQLSNEQFEAIMRPIFKDDELLMVTVGAVLGFLVGELQVELVTHLSR